MSVNWVRQREIDKEISSLVRICLNFDLDTSLYFFSLWYHFIPMWRSCFICIYIFAFFFATHTYNSINPSLFVLKFVENMYEDIVLQYLWKCIICLLWTIINKLVFSFCFSLFCFYFMLRFKTKTFTQINCTNTG